MPTRISSRSANVNALARPLRCRTITTPSSPARRRNVFLDTPAPAAASSYVAPPATANNPGNTTARGILGRPTNTPTTRSCRAPPLTQPGHFNDQNPFGGRVFERQPALGEADEDTLWRSQ